MSMLLSFPPVQDRPAEHEFQAITTNMNPADIRNDTALRESAYIADQLLKRLNPVQPTYHQTEILPVRQNRIDAPTSHIPSTNTSPMIQKPLPPQLSSTRSRMHLNSLLIPQLRNKSYLGKRKVTEQPVTENPFGIISPPPPRQQPARAAQTMLPLRRNSLYTIQEVGGEVLDNNNNDHHHQPKQFVLFPSQRLPPAPPSRPELAKVTYDKALRQYRVKTPPKPTATSTSTATTTTAAAAAAGTGTGKRRAGCGVGIPVPILQPAPPGRRRRRERERKLKGAGSGGGSGSGSNVGVLGRSQGGEGWEEVKVHGVGGHITA